MAAIPYQGFVGGTYGGTSRHLSAEQCINLYPEPTSSAAITPKSALALRHTPGLKRFATAGHGPIRGAFFEPGTERLFVVSGGDVYEITIDGVPTKLGSVSQGRLPVTWASNGVGGQQVMLTAGGLGYIIDLATDSFEQISDVDFPGAVIGCAYLGTYFIVVPWNSRRFHFSAQLNGLAWSAGDLAQKADTPDVIRGLVVHDQVVRLIGSRTTETWYNSGDALTPFVPVQGTTIDVGMGPLRSAQYVGGAVLAISESQAGNRELLALTSQSPAILTPPGVSRAWGQYATVDDAYAWSYRQDGRWFYVVSFPSAKRTWVFDQTTRIWHERRYRASTGEEHHLGSCHALAFGKHLVGSRGDGTIYEMSQSLYDDDGTAIRRVRRSPHIFTNNRDVTINRLALHADVGHGLATGQGSDPTSCSACRRTAATPGATRSLGDTGAPGQYGYEVEWWMLGQGRDWVIELAASDPIPHLWSGASVDAEGDLD